MTVLVIDDDPNVTEMIRDALQSNGYRCLVASSAEEADARLAANEVDGVTLDLHMPGRSGLEWLEALENVRPGLARKTLLVTGSQLGPDQIRQLRRCGATLLFKPFCIERLLVELADRLVKVAGSAHPAAA
jgi:DNA-binding response OmpR family regulator